MNQETELLNKILQQLVTQQKILEQLGSRLNAIESSLGIVEVHRSDVATNYKYPDLAPIQKAEDFDTPEKRKGWWDGLEEQWQKALIANSLNVKLTSEALKTYNPTDEELQYILESPTLIVVGAKGQNTRIDFELTNLSGVKHLTNLSILIVTHHQITSLAGIEYLNQLENLFVNANQLTNLKEVHYLPNLTQLYCNDNQIKDLQPLARLTKLTTIHCNYNQLINFEGITINHTQNLKNFICLPNDKIYQREIKRLEAINIQCKKG